MEMTKQYVTMSLELHLFFARIMKEHSLFLMAGFMPKNKDFFQKAEFFKTRFEQLLQRAVDISQGAVSAAVIQSGEIVTEHTLFAEERTQQFTGIKIDQAITKKEQQLHIVESFVVQSQTARQVKQLNQTAVKLLDGLIELKEMILQRVSSCQMFTANYPLLLKHIIREAKLYRNFVLNYEQKQNFDGQNMKQSEQFWNQIMMEHAMFIRGLLDPSENELIKSADTFSKEYAMLLNDSNKMNEKMMTEKILQETKRFRDFKQAGTTGILDCKIQSIILPLLADHVLREANHYIRLLQA